MGPCYGVDNPCPTGYEILSCALSPGLKATAQLLELSLGWQGERNTLASEKIQACGTRGE